MSTWELTIIDACAPTETLTSLMAFDIDGDGNEEIITGGEGGLLWYRPNTNERGIIAKGKFRVGIDIADIDGDGQLEVVTGELDELSDNWMISWFKPQDDLKKPWQRYVIDYNFEGNPHDVRVFDIDQDGTDEVIAVGAYVELPAIMIFKPNSDVKREWRKNAVQRGFATEGLAFADVNGDGNIEIISSSDYYVCPQNGAFSGAWERIVFAPDMRDMSRVIVADISGTGRQDIIVCESEYIDGRLCWYENIPDEKYGCKFIEHVIDEELIFAHSLDITIDKESNALKIFIAEMREGGFPGCSPNFSPRMMFYETRNKGLSFKRDVFFRDAGTHQSILYDIDQDGQLEVLGKEFKAHKIFMLKKVDQPSLSVNFKHTFIDRDKPKTGTDILTSDVDGDGVMDILCSRWWYKAPEWTRYEIPDIYVVHSAYDIDGDGRDEYIASKKATHFIDGGFHASTTTGFYEGLTSRLVWIKPIDPCNGIWEEYFIGEGMVNEWAHSFLIAPILPNGRKGLFVGYHAAHRPENQYRPHVFEIPDDPKQSPWPKRNLAEIPYGEEMAVSDIDNNGVLDIYAGPYWLENLGDGQFTPHKFVPIEYFRSARVSVADINKNGREDVVMCEEVIDFDQRVVPLSMVVWSENPEHPKDDRWPFHIIDTVRCPHSLSVDDVDNDGELEVIVGEHDPFAPYRNKCRLYIYKKADKEGIKWKRYTIDRRFEHHDGAKIIELSDGKKGIISHAWTDSRYIHLWTLE